MEDRWLMVGLCSFWQNKCGSGWLLEDSDL
ncbi:MAG: hypothetical protein UT14_C0057G0001, partial [Candidatus Shapirobacteria bacterium GW2011_GWE1_38_92]